MNNFMFLSGFFSIFQITIIPGIILLKLFKIKTISTIQLLLYSFGLSLFSNYLIVCLLTWLKLYTSSIIYILFSIEAVYLFFLFFIDIKRYRTGKSIKDYFALLRDFLYPLRFSYKIIFSISCVLILFFISLIPINAGTSYYFIDALNHWTRWPVQWAANNFPVNTAHYPQLFPANLSLIYVFTGEPGFQFFPKLIMPLFFIGNLLIFFDIGILHKSLTELTGLIIYSLILLTFYSVLFILEVNADIPVSFFSFLTFYTIIRNEQEGFNLKTIILVTIFAAAAALTKLAGFYILTLAIAWIFFNFYTNRNKLSWIIFLKAGAYIILILAGSIFWYLVRPAAMIKGLDQSPYLQPGYYIRFVTAVRMLLYTFSLPFLIFLLVTIVASVFARESKYIVLFIILPAVILWAFFFSADFRNLSFAIPFIAYASGYGILVLYKPFNKSIVWEKASVPKIFFEKNKILISGIVVLSLMLGYIISGTDLIFNMGIKSAYIFHNLFSGNYRLNYFNEIGYYRYVEYILSAFRLLCIILFVLFVIKNLPIKISYLFSLTIVICLIAGLGFLNKYKMWDIQNHDKKLVIAHNLYSKIYPFVNIPGQSSLIIANDILFSQLIPPSQVEFHYLKEIDPSGANQLNGKYNRKFLLLEKEKLGKEFLSYIANKKANNSIDVCFEDEEFVFILIKV